MDIRFHFIRQEIDQGRINLQWTSTPTQAADGLTKALGKVAFDRFCDMVNPVNCKGRF